MIVPQQQYPTNATKGMIQTTRFVSGCARGFISGYKRGMYKDNNYRLSAQCFGSETQYLIIDTFDLWNGKEIDWLREVVNFQKALLLITDNCEYDEALYDILSYCYDGEACEPSNMMQTLLKKVFQVTTVANDMAQLILEGVPTETDPQDKVEDFAERIGSNVGKLLRYATDFDPTKIPSVMF